MDQNQENFRGSEGKENGTPKQTQFLSKLVKAKKQAQAKQMNGFCGSDRRQPELSATPIDLGKLSNKKKQSSSN